MIKRLGAALLCAGIALTGISAPAAAGPLMERLKAGQPIRIGFGNEPIYAYPGENGDPKGFANAVAIAVLKDMGAKDIQATVMDWSGLIPGLQASRYDVITGGMYILGTRCKNVAFSDPIAKTSDALLVRAGNPKGLQNYKDVHNKGAVFYTNTGSSLIEVAKKEGLTDQEINLVPGPSEVMAAVKSGRADAGGLTYFEAKHMAEASNGSLEVTNPANMPEGDQNWVGIGFRSEDADFLAKFNETLKKFIASPRWVEAVKPYGLTNVNLPGSTTTQWICANR
ncbi:transporter substrate-binding domain-containing protein [Caballeronia sp. EK]|uniref:transporter substrate-binding domain-containing protein n=1 Tax=Caballeronia sp. EK TaxID=2767469 RepID=UPI0016566A9C|nr:transporter substrate-binding domain-containing protein [Caballeronia sp. EK]MBC8641642.1 transporter substrate-binding domain-containing protein [Caballeronia sp. EK]